MKKHSSSTERKPKRMKKRNYDHHFSKRTGTKKRETKYNINLLENNNISSSSLSVSSTQVAQCGRPHMNTSIYNLRKNNLKKRKNKNNVEPWSEESLKDYNNYIHNQDKQKMKIYRRIDKSTLIDLIKNEIKLGKDKYRSYHQHIKRKCSDENLVFDMNCQNILNQKKGIKILALLLNKRFIPQEICSMIISNCLNNIHIESDIYKLLPDAYFLSIKKIEYNQHNPLKHIKRFKYLQKENPTMYKLIIDSLDPCQRYFIDTTPNYGVMFRLMEMFFIE